MSFDFEVPSSSGNKSSIKFTPKVVVQNVSQKDIDRVGLPALPRRQAGGEAGEASLDNLVFQLGLAEMPSYWKATSSPKIVVEAGALNKTQINWWHNLFMQGMGQFFYENKINFTSKNFLTIASTGQSRGVILTRKLSNKALIPIGGGKDAVVTYETLQAAKQRIKPFILNPKKEQLDFLKVVGLSAGASSKVEDSAIVVQRTIDPKLLELNRKGYVNGHTPFSAYLAFLTTLCAALFDYKYIALSNEHSSEQGNVQYLNHTINHQYSKSFAFEKAFQTYSKKYLAAHIEYFSFLRPLHELQIAKLFTQYPKHFATFLSCNEAHKTNSGKVKPTGKWCGVCSKCLFVFASLYPFIETKKLTKIFGRNLFEDPSLIPLMEELVGERNFKPFECIGTTKESLAAFYLSLQKTHPPLPPLLQHFRGHIVKKYPNLHQESKVILSSWNKNHAIPNHLEKVLQPVLK
jgi:UDP-N-acetyl-alpha-D-muramoyl-L-alanyl-L-glutamate epimerase